MRFKQWRYISSQYSWARNPEVGELIFETDTQQLKFWSGAEWVRVIPANGFEPGVLYIDLSTEWIEDLDAVNVDDLI